MCIALRAPPEQLRPEPPAEKRALIRLASLPAAFKFHQHLRPTLPWRSTRGAMIPSLCPSLWGWFSCSPRSPVPSCIDTAPGLKALSPVALASIAWVAMMYTFFGGQVVAKFEPEPDEKVMEISLRTMMNTLEQAPCFFISMWLHAIFVNPEIAGVLGLFYVAARFFYGYLYGMYGQFTMAAELTTQPNCELLRPHSREPRTWAPV